MNLGLNNRVALVCGGSSGLGKAIATTMALEGARVALNGRDEARLAAAAAEVSRQATADVVTFAADVSVPAQATALVDRVIHAMGRLDILLCNAAGPAAGPFLTTPADAWRRAIELNLLSTINLCRAAVPHMIKRQWGRILCLTSMAAKQPMNGLILSTTARAGVLGFAKSLADEVAGQGITVNALCPGYFLTDRVTDLAEQRATQQKRAVDEVMRDAIGTIPMGRMGRPEELAWAAAFLASERTSYITGTAFSVDGGFARTII
jgi:3-oxoacyl-[acyl-carrier protein] reductase